MLNNELNFLWKFGIESQNHLVKLRIWVKLKHKYLGSVNRQDESREKRTEKNRNDNTPGF